MILGIGVDLVAIERIKSVYDKYPERFLNRIFTEREQKYFRRKAFSAAALAARFAAKEASLKAIGCGVGPAALKEVEIIAVSGKQPLVKLHGHASRLAREKNITSIAVSMTHEPPFACAVAAAYQAIKPASFPAAWPGRPGPGQT